MNFYEFAAADGNPSSLDLEAIAFSRQKSLDRLPTETFCILISNMNTTSIATMPIGAPTMQMASINANGPIIMRLQAHGH